MRGKAAACLLALLMSVTVLTTGVFAWEKEQQALNNVREQNDTNCLPVEVTLPTVKKVVEGKNAPNEKFTFVLKGKKDAPMPEDASGRRCTVSRLGRGTVSFGSIVFDQPGTYVYTVYEVDGGDINWTYDDAEYTLTITVEQDGEVLTAAYTIRKDGKTASRIVFTNTYEAIDLNEKVTISGQKTWLHGTNPEENQPDHIIVMIYADGTLIQQKNVTEKSDWKYSFVLPRYTEAGQEIRYTVDEAAVTDYSKQISGYDITNTYVGLSIPVVPTDPVLPENPTTPAEPAAPTEPGTDATKPVTPSKPPKTGDEFPLTLWLALMALALCGFVTMLVLLVRTRHTYQGRRLKIKGKRLQKKRARGA